MAQEAKFHSHCLVKLYNACNRKVEKGKKENPYGITLVELIGYTEETKMNAKDVGPIFKMTDLIHSWPAVQNEKSNTCKCDLS